MQEIFDLIIIGAGPAGLAAGIYASRRKLKTLIFAKNIGGQAAYASQVENYPGYEAISGFDLMQKFQKQAERFGCDFKYEEVIEVKKEKNNFIIRTGSTEYKSLAIILAFGMTPRNLNVSGEKEFLGRGVAYCATCDGPLFRNKTVAVVGGGNAALESVLYLASICKKVYQIHRRDEFTGEAILVDKIKGIKNVELVLDSVVTKINGNKFVQSVEVENLKTKMKKEIALDGVFIEIGHVVNAKPVKNLVKIDENNAVIIDSDCQTNVAGCFGAGDVTNIKYKQIVISAGEGAKAALSAYKYLQRLENKESPLFDWGNK
ncbi:thioredoxin-disulfide reductase [Candidatus Falkowbacteria bacterium]|nr:thioredoxin-disulfide reductase [Candidatus Falkowbacteria bacterium]